MIIFIDVKPGTMHKIIVLTWLVLFTFPGFGQECLLIKHNRRDKTFSYCLGDKIQIQTKSLSKKYSGDIVSLKDSVLVLERPVKNAKQLGLMQDSYRDYIVLSDIEAVYVGNKGFVSKFRYAYSGTAMVGGGILIGTNSVNSLIDGGAPSYQKMILATGILVSGFIVRHLGREKFKIGKNWTIQIEKVEEKSSDQSEEELPQQEKAN